MTPACLLAFTLTCAVPLRPTDDFTSELLARVETVWTAVRGKTIDEWVWRDKNRFVLPYEELVQHDEPSARERKAAAKQLAKLARKERDEHHRWRLHELAATLHRDAGDPKASLKEWRLALEDYPDERYPDPSRQSAFPHLANATAAVLWDVSGAQQAEDFLLELVTEDRRMPGVALDGWIEHLFAAGEGARLAAFAERLQAAYGAKGDREARDELARRRLPMQRQAGGNERMSYVLFPPVEARRDQPVQLVLVLPGGSGQAADFLPWLSSVQTSLGDDYALAVLTAPRWNERQASECVWVTEVAQERHRDAEFTSEAFVDAVHDDVRASGLLQVARVVLMGWSSGGPPTYGALLRENSPFDAAFVLASVFRPKELALEHAAGKRFYLAQGQSDPKTPPHWAESADRELRAAGAEVRLEIFQGGHGFAMQDPLGSVKRMLAWTLR